MSERSLKPERAELSRREFQQRAVLIGSAAFMPALDVRGISALAPASTTNMNRAADTLDEALELLKSTGPEFGGGLSNHGPMVAEALCVLGRESAVIPWVKGYKRRLTEPPIATRPIAPEAWKSALGDFTRAGDWNAFMEREFVDQPWETVLDTWVLRLTPGLSAAAAHGIIRAGHAVRGLGARDTPLRRRELAHGLAYWAARYQEFRAADHRSSLRSDMRTALSRIETVRPKGKASTGLISDGLLELNQRPSFGSVIDYVDASGDPSAFLSDLTETFAHVYLANVRDAGRRITFVHSVTGPSALRLIAPHVKPDTARAALRYAWQLAAGLYAAYGNPSAVEKDEEESIEVQALVDLALKSGDDHAIKFTEACLREHALNAKPIYLAAARDACRHLKA